MKIHAISWCNNLRHVGCFWDNFSGVILVSGAYGRKCRDYGKSYFNKEDFENVLGGLVFKLNFVLGKIKKMFELSRR
jgi:hypothetical protein